MTAGNKIQGVARAIALSICMIAGSVTAAAQTKAQIRANMRKDLGAFVGVCSPVRSDAEAGTMLGLTYGRFGYNGLGFRTGFQFTYDMADIDRSFGVPIAFTYRTGSRTTSQRVADGVISAAGSLFESLWWDDDHPVQSAIMSFLVGLFSQMEFFVGVTPGYVAGSSQSEHVSHWGTSFQENWQRTWTEKTNSFAFTLDGGFCLNYRIGRIDLKVTPAAHYSLTKNYCWHEESGTYDTEGGAVTEHISTTPLRWFFSATGGLSYKF